MKMLEQLKSRAFIVILIFSGFLVYSNTLYAPFVFDDVTYVENVGNYMEYLGIHGILGVPRYIGFLSFAINYYFDGLDTFGYHLVNIIIHIINAILVYVLIQLTIRVLGFKDSRVQEPFSRPLDPLAHRLLPFTVSLIFLVHPIQTQAVTYITQRFSSLATLFYLLAIVLYIKARLKGKKVKRIKGEKEFYLFTSLPFYLLSLISAILAMKTKEISFTLPFIIILYEFTFFKSSNSQKRFLFLIPYLLTLIIIPFDIFYTNPATTAAYITGLKDDQWRDLTSLSKCNYLLTQFSVIVKYIRLLFFPIKQHFGPDHPISTSIFETRTFVSFIFLASIFGFAVYLYLKSRNIYNIYGLLTAFGMFWFFITLSIESSIIPIKDVIFEHRLYLPSIGFILSAVAAYFYLFDRVENKKYRSTLIFFIFIAILSLSFTAYKRNSIYTDIVAVWLNEVRYSPNGSFNHARLGIAYLGKNMFDEAEREFKIAVELAPFDSMTAVSHINLGIIYEYRNLLDDAEKEYKAAIRLSGNRDNVLKQAHVRLGDLYYEKGLFDQSIAAYEEAIKLQPSAIIYNRLGDIYVKKGLLYDASMAFIAAVNLAPDDADAHYNLGIVYANLGLLDDAIKEYLTALKLNPNDADAHNNLGSVYYKSGRLDDAIKEYVTALKLGSNNPHIHYNLGLAYWRRGLKHNAIKEFEITLKINPDFKDAREALSKVAE